MKFPKLNNDVKTTVYNKLPTAFNEIFLHTENWLTGKRMDDGAEGLWRIHNNLYDFTNFIDRHPGGSEWLVVTKGTDITEAFETHHISTKPETKLVNYFVRTTEHGRYSPFTFEENGFYRTLKSRVRQNQKEIPKWPVIKSKIITDTLLATTLALIAGTSWVNNIYIGAGLGLLAGVTLGLTTIASHNFTHQRDNFRMYYMNLSFIRSRDWRITHALSHHLYTNTTNDVEILGLPHFNFLPSKKPTVIKYFPILAFLPVFGFMFFGYFVKGLYNRLKFRNDGLKFSDFLPFILPGIMFAIGYKSPILTGILYLWIMLVGSFYFTFIGIVACHHHPDGFHDGDAMRPKEEMDWGINQIDAALDRKMLNKSHFLVLTSFGDHILHHLFPAMDHGVLPYVRPYFEETCQDFGIDIKSTSEFDCVIGAYKQLFRDANPIPPKPINDKFLGGNDSNVPSITMQIRL